MSVNRRPDKGHHASRLVPPSAGRLPTRSAGDAQATSEGRAKSAPSQRAGNQHVQSTVAVAPPAGNDRGHHPGSMIAAPYDSRQRTTGVAVPQSDSSFLGSDVIAGLTSTGNYVSLEYDPSLGRPRSRGVQDGGCGGRGTSPGQLTNDSKAVIDSHIQVINYTSDN
jgi:hypothetical protein